MHIQLREAAQRYFGGGLKRRCARAMKSCATSGKKKRCQVFSTQGVPGHKSRTKTHTDRLQLLYWKNNGDKKMPIESRLLFERKGQTERPSALGTLAEALRVEATAAFWSSAGSPRRFPRRSPWLQLQIRRGAHKVFGFPAFLGVTDYPGVNPVRMPRQNLGQTVSVTG